MDEQPKVPTRTRAMCLRGSCLCDAVAYEIQARLKAFYFCHCSQCRKLSGSAHAANILADPAAINWLRGEQSLKRYDAADGRSFTHVFCRHCGSGLPFHNVSGTTLLIPAGTLDTEPGISVDKNIFWDESPGWYESGLTADRCRAFPD